MTHPRSLHVKLIYLSSLPMLSDLHHQMFGTLMTASTGKAPGQGAGWNWTSAMKGMSLSLAFFRE